MQQYRTNPSLARVPSLQTSDESLCSGLSPFPQEYPVAGTWQPATLESCAQPAATGGGGAICALAVHPRSPATHPATPKACPFMTYETQANRMPTVGSGSGLIRA